MKKLNLVLIFTTLLLFVSCSSDDEGLIINEENLIGLWNFQEGNVDGEPVLDTETVLFRENGTLRFEYTGNDFGEANYTINGSQIVMEFNGQGSQVETYTYTITELSQSRLKWTTQLSNNRTVSETYTK